jgi:RNA recognition motif-containing protein
MRLFVCNINPEVQEADVMDLFQKYGEILGFHLEQDKETCRSKGYAYIDMSYADAGRAQNELNGLEYRGYELVVKPARSGEG